jgi:hypothetical protein
MLFLTRGFRWSRFLGETKSQVCELKPQVKAIRTAAPPACASQESEIRTTDRSSNAFQFKIATLIPK